LLELLNKVWDLGFGDGAFKAIWLKAKNRGPHKYKLSC